MPVLQNSKKPRTNQQDNEGSLAIGLGESRAHVSNDESNPQLGKIVNRTFFLPDGKENSSGIPKGPTGMTAVPFRVVRISFLKGVPEDNGRVRHLIPKGQRFKRTVRSRWKSTLSCVRLDNNLAWLNSRLVLHLR
ncbi:hypothetical protein NPIL_592021 [Nephila pilipes]|uniref:Uncharacterized protein n=1 Tax=Nephila pilipes TaxID=299642 RepID=A0A8X6PPX6_NEPPI|nr:hypothetical protein NPIL_592021 [Nephila pilipes]